MNGRVRVNYGTMNFPRWLGQYSKNQKLQRFGRELQLHTRLRTSCNPLGRLLV